MGIFRAISNFYTRLHINKGGMTYWECTRCGYGFFGGHDGTT
jgi:hypothetical protein